MQVAKQDITNAAAVIKAAKRIVIIAHRSPDGDTLGCNLALYHALSKQTDKKVLPVCIDRPSDRLHFLPGLRKLKQDFDPADFDLAISLDAGDKSLLIFWEQKEALRTGKLPLLNIDHHQGNDHYGTHNLVVTTAAATALPVYYLLKLLKLEITADIATCLMTGFYYDTGSFMHPNTNAEIMSIAAQLTEKGAELTTISKKMLNTNPLNRLHLWGRVLERIHLNDQQIASSAITQTDFAETKTEPEDISGIIDYLNMIPQNKMAIMLHEDFKGNIKGSLRTKRTDINLAKIAHHLGGGGHAQASGFSIPGKLKTT